MATDEIVIDRDRVVELFTECVEKRGREYAHDRTKCVYFAWDGSPSCAVGWILNRVGVTARHFEDLGPIIGTMGTKCDPNDAKWNLLWPNLENLPDLPLRFTEEAVSTLGTIQARQDYGIKYGGILDALRTWAGA